jgi:hypothetical protein
MINLSTNKFLKILLGFVAIAYFATIMLSIFSSFPISSAYELGREVGYNIGFVSPYLIGISIILIGFFLVNLGIRRISVIKK